MGNTFSRRTVKSSPVITETRYYNECIAEFCMFRGYKMICFRSVFMPVCRVHEAHFLEKTNYANHLIFIIEKYTKLQATEKTSFEILYSPSA